MWILECKGTYHEVHFSHYINGSAVFVYTKCTVDIALTLNKGWYFSKTQLGSNVNTGYTLNYRRPVSSGNG